MINSNFVLYKVQFSFPEYSFYRFVRAESREKAIECCKNKIDFNDLPSKYYIYASTVNDSPYQVFL